MMPEPRQKSCLVERRKFERFPLRIPAAITVAAEGQQQETLSLLTSNVSAGGAFIPTNARVPKGARVQLKLRLPSERIQELAEVQGKIVSCIVIGGTVVRSDSSGMAISLDKRYRHLRLNLQS